VEPSDTVNLHFDMGQSHFFTANGTAVI